MFLGHKQSFILCCAQTGPSGKVVGIEHIEELVQMSLKNVQADDPVLLSSGRIRLIGESSSFSDV